jgi:2-oxoglutarate ferredoxin oxidoreductase subunit alpha
MIAAGVGVYVGYPMSPATSILNTLAQHGSEVGIAVEQVEDEIAALNAAIGAAYAGARAATGSSGGGLSLMTEAIGLAGVTETPVVIVDAQRSGPATGMATRTEQSDLLFIVHAAQGEFPRVVLSPSDHEDAFYLTAEAFNLAERWQLPVFILDDQAFADAQCSVPEYDLSKVAIDRGLIAPEPEQSAVLRRYEVTDSGVSPRAYPVLSRWIVVQDSHEHDEVGHLTDDPGNRVSQVEKRMRKLVGVAATLPGPEVIHGDADTLLLCWGSTAGPLREALGILRERGHDLGAAVFRYLYPMNEDNVQSALRSARQLLTVEGNYTGQLGQLLLLQTGISVHGHIGKIDGRLFTVEDVLELVERDLENRT